MKYRLRLLYSSSDAAASLKKIYLGISFRGGGRWGVKKHIWVFFM